jgi:hypothetical protein
MGWTEARMDTLRTMWLAGESAKRISEALGEVTRNAVMGKVHRMGLMGSADHNSRITGRIFGACRPIMPGDAVVLTAEPATAEIVDVVPRMPEATTVETVQEVEVVSQGDPIILREEIVVEAERHLIVEADNDDDDDDDDDGDDAEEAEDAVREDADEARSDVDADAPTGFLDEVDEVEEEEEVDDEPPVARRRRYPSIRKVVDELPPMPAAPEVVRIGGGVIATAQDGTERGVVPDWMHAVSVVSRLTGQDFDMKRPGHRGSLVAVATILAGDPRRILCPRLGEPEVLQMMRRLATGGMIVGGKSPERWRDPVEGDASFFDDMLTVEEVKDRWKVRIERSPVPQTEQLPIAA